MYNIELNEFDLIKRSSSVRGMLDPICYSKTGLASGFVHTGDSFTKIISAYEGSKPSKGHREWRFTTHHPQFKANYHEVWKLSDLKKRNWYMDRVYLHIFYFSKASEDEIDVLALHCDPNEPIGKHQKYKQSPHLHFWYPKSPFRHAHVALNKMEIDKLIFEISLLDDAIKSAIEMIVHQIIIPSEQYFFTLQET
jgi:hypothetical protein